MARFSFVLPAMVGLAVSVSTVALAAGGGNWAGPYAGAQFGYGNASDDNVNTSGQLAGNISNVAGGARPASVSLDADGLVGGVMAGYNWQSGNAVFGLEADINLTDIEDSKSVGTLSLATATPPLAALNNNFKQSLDYLGTVRARVGYAFQNTMVYGTGGLAYGGVDNSVNFFAATAPTGPLQFQGSDDELEYGYALGGGIEQMVNPKWVVSANYLYYDLGSKTTNVAAVPGVGTGGYNSKFDTAGHIFRAGVGYKF